MKYFAAAFFLGFFVNSFSAPLNCQTYASDLEIMLQVDQSIRERIDWSLMPTGNVKEAELPKAFQQMLVVDKQNTARLHALVKACGWPKKSVHGEKASGAAWILAQHAEPEAQRSFLPFLKTAVEAGEASMSDLAYLTDRMATRDGKPQLYGTQFHQKSTCEFEFDLMDDRNKVNERRKSAGMPSLEEYELMFRDFMLTQGCPKK